LLGEPEVLFLDEPTTGLDPRGRSQMWDTIREVLAGGATVLLTTQYLEEADALADQIAVIDHGNVVASGTPTELKGRIGSQTLQVRAADRTYTRHVADAVATVVGIRPDISADNGLVTVAITDPAMLPAIVRLLDDLGIVAAELALRLPSLDEVFLTLTGHPAENSSAASAARDGRAA
jgi:oleandomycin transport system ATP-binding protein